MSCLKRMELKHHVHSTPFLERISIPHYASQYRSSANLNNDCYGDPTARSTIDFGLRAAVCMSLGECQSDSYIDWTLMTH